MRRMGTAIVVIPTASDTSVTLTAAAYGSFRSATPIDEVPTVKRGPSSTPIGTTPEVGKTEIHAGTEASSTSQRTGFEEDPSKSSKSVELSSVELPFVCVRTTQGTAV